MALHRIRIVLVEPSHGGNIGGCARAMKTMGLSRLVLVAPQAYPSAEATARAVGAEDVLKDAQLCGSLEEAIADCSLVIGTSARNRRIPWPQLTPAAAAAQLRSHTEDPASPGEAAVLFGRERTGLTNDELDHCRYLLNIPANPAFSSLNLACAVQVVACEIWTVHQLRSTPTVAEMLGEPLATQQEIQGLYDHLERIMIETQFLDPDNPRLLMRRIMRLFNRTQITANEINILRGILSALAQEGRQGNN